MASSWAICPICGQPVAVEPVDFPGEPMEMHRHRLEKHPPIPAKAAPESSLGRPREAPLDLPRPPPRRR